MNKKEEIEEWRDVPGYEGKYQVSNFGNVKTLNRTVIGNNCSYMRKGKILNKYYGGRTGYYKVKLYNGDGSFNSFPVHRLVAQSFLYNPESYPQINHRDGNPENNNVNNLEWCNNSINIKHAYDTGLINMNNRRGANHYKAILTEDDVRNIRYKHDIDKTPLKNLMNEYNMSHGAIYGIVKHKNWKYV